MKSFIVSIFAVIVSSLIGCTADDGGPVKDQPVVQDAGTDCGYLGCPIRPDPCYNGGQDCPIRVENCTMFVTQHDTCVQCDDAAAVTCVVSH